MSGSRFQWVGSGRVAFRYVSPIPPLEPCWRLSSHTAHERRTFTGKFHFANSTEFPGVSLRVRWVPLYHFPPLSLRAFAMCAVFPCSDYYAQFDCLQGLGDFGTGLPCLLPTLLAIPCRLSRVHRG